MSDFRSKLLPCPHWFNTVFKVSLLEWISISFFSSRTRYIALFLPIFFLKQTCLIGWERVDGPHEFPWFWIDHNLDVLSPTIQIFKLLIMNQGKGGCKQKWKAIPFSFYKSNNACIDKTWLLSSFTLGFGVLLCPCKVW